MNKFAHFQSRLESENSTLAYARDLRARLNRLGFEVTRIYASSAQVTATRYIEEAELVELGLPDDYPIQLFFDPAGQTDSGQNVAQVGKALGKADISGWHNVYAAFNPGDASSTWLATLIRVPGIETVLQAKLAELAAWPKTGSK